MEAHRGTSGPSHKRVKKEIDLQCKELESLKGCISHKESYLQEDMPEQDVPKGTTHSTRVPKWLCLPTLESTTLLLRASWLQSPAHLLVRTLPWRWMRGPLAHLPLAQSPERTTISSMRMGQWKWRQAWPTSQSRLPVDKSERVRTPPSLRHLPLLKVKKFKL